MFSTLITFMIFFNGQNITPTTPGQYYEVVRVEYDASVDKTYGVFARYSIDENGRYNKYHYQLRNLDGKKTEQDLIKNAPHDSNITLIREQ